jgi:hypothetical protein
MADIAFECPSCSQALEAPDECAGQVIQCPACEQEITVPAAPAAEEAAPLSVLGALDSEPEESAAPPAEGGCPGCGAELAEGAAICIQCGLNIKTGEKINTDLG